MILENVLNTLKEIPGLTVKEMAARLGMTPDQLSYTIRSLTGQPLNLFIRQWRLRRIRELLDDEELSYTEVARRCGFTSVQAMSKFLDRWTKRTAYEYRVGKSNGHRTSHKQDIRSDKQERTACK